MESNLNEKVINPRRRNDRLRDHTEDRRIYHDTPKSSQKADPRRRGMEAGGKPSEK